MQLRVYTSCSSTSPSSGLDKSWPRTRRHTEAFGGGGDLGAVLQLPSPSSAMGIPKCREFWHWYGVDRIRTFWNHCSASLQWIQIKVLLFRSVPTFPHPICVLHILYCKILLVGTSHFLQLVFYVQSHIWSNRRSVAAFFLTVKLETSVLSGRSSRSTPLSQVQ